MKRELVPAVASCVQTLVPGNDTVSNREALLEIQRLAHALHGGAPDSLEAAYATEQLAEAILHGTMPCDNEAILMFQDALCELQAAVASPSVMAATATTKPKTTVVTNDLLEGFREEAAELLDRAWAGLGSGDFQEVRRAVHTLKGSAAMVGMRNVANLAHAMEDTLDAIHGGERPYGADSRDLFAQTLEVISEALASGGEVPALHALLTAYGRPPAVAPPAEPEAAPAAAAAAAVAPAEPSPRHIRVNLEHLDATLRGIGELGVIRSGLDQQIAANRRQLDELSLAIRRCQRIAQRLDYEFAVYSPGSGSPWSPDVSGSSSHAEFDALEFDRYTEFHLLSRDLLETASDLTALEGQLSTVATELDSIRARQSKTCSELQDRVLHMRMAPAGTLAPRLERTVLGAAAALGKQVTFRMEGEQTELDKAVLEALAAPLEHLLRNSVSHGIEGPATRLASGKPQQGSIKVSVVRDGSNTVFQVSDDGAGIDDNLVRRTAVESGLITQADAATLQGKALYALLFEAGFSTAASVTQVAGRGVGLDIVQAAVEGLKGSITVESAPGAGTTMILRLPVAQSILRVLFVEAGGETYAIPLANVLRAGRAVVVASSERLRQVSIEDVLQLPQPTPQGRAKRSAVVLDCGVEQIVLLVSGIQQIREVLVQPPAGILKKAPAIAGATTLADGKVVLVLQPARLLRTGRKPSSGASIPQSTAAPVQALDILVVDDSVSVRRVVGGTLRTQGWTVSTAKDGLEALEVLHAMARLPDAILLDIEMPRMDGYDLITALRSEPQFARIPAIMLTSRGGDKHRQKAFEAGATDFLVKPYRDEDLIAAVLNHVTATSGGSRVA